MSNGNSYCGINCYKCPVYMATNSNSLEKKKEIAEAWGKMYKRAFLPEEMTCYGCKSKTHFLLCSKCDIVDCNKSRENEHCGECAIYPCERIQKFESSLKEKDLYYL